ncbi:AaceriADL005Cp [[Ashbya] aceris (nom. inval.)]|nr:AaceriADL005Cp [[Ashbya] aceris (nom. inval.)]
MSFLFSGESRSPKNTSTERFVSIRGSDAYKELCSLGMLPSSKDLRQDSIFRAVANEVKQVRQDVVEINSRVVAEVQLEKELAEHLNQKLRASEYKVDHLAKKVVRLRQKHSTNTQRQVRKLDECIEDFEHNIRELQSTVADMVDRLESIDVGLPEKERLIGDHQLNARHYPLLYELFRDKFPSKFGALRGSGADSSLPEMAFPKAWGEPETGDQSHHDVATCEVPPLEMGSAEEACFYHPQNLAADHIRNHFMNSRSSDINERELEISGSAHATKASSARENIPERILMPQFQKVASPQTAPTLENIEVTVPFSSKSAGHERQNG